eukprot:6597550-Lingulodinium_polyedra.AAC.1
MEPAMLRRVDHGVLIDVVRLSIYWHEPATANDQHPLNNCCRDLVFSAQRVRQGLDLDVELFKRR